MGTLITLEAMRAATRARCAWYSSKRRRIHPGIGIGAVVLASLAVPPIGLPLAAGLAAFGTIKLSPLHMILRGRTVTPQHRDRLALISGIVMLSITAIFSGGAYGFQVANRLEERLYSGVESAHADGRLEIGRVFHECEKLACASATIVQMPGNQLFGIAELSGFVLKKKRLFGWRKGPVAVDRRSN